MNEHDLVVWLMPAIASGVGIGIWQILGKIFDSLQSLNVKIAVIIEKQNNYEVRLERLEINKEIL